MSFPHNDVEDILHESPDHRATTSSGHEHKGNEEGKATCRVLSYL